MCRTVNLYYWYSADSAVSEASFNQGALRRKIEVISTEVRASEHCKGEGPESSVKESQALSVRVCETQGK